MIWVANCHTYCYTLNIELMCLQGCVVSENSKNYGQKVERISFRTTTAVKLRIEEAAAVYGTGITQFLETCALEKALEILSRENKIVLSGRSREAFLYLLDNPRPSTKTMEAALKHFRQLGLDKEKK